MEVHHHGHHEGEKKWKSYFFEFLMLFIAVSAGFFMENLREHHVEREREEQYMKSFVNDLVVDTININIISNRCQSWKQNADSLFLLLSSPNYSDQLGAIYFHSRRVSLRDFFYITDGTIKQLNNAGGLRLIQHQNIVDSINSYENTYDNIERAQQLKEIQLCNYRDACAKVFNVVIYEEMVNGTTVMRPLGNPPLLSKSEIDINEVLMKAHYIKRNNSGILELLVELKQKSINLQNIIRQQYHF